MVDLADDLEGGLTRTGRTGGPSSSSSRRGFLTAAAFGVAGLASAGAVAGDVYAVRRGVFASGSGAAYRPWQEWDQGSLPLRLVRAGILAANAHNAQIWRFAVSPSRIDVYDDPTRSTGAVDTYRRELHLSAGAAIENITLAARAAGLAPVVTLRPGADPGHLATVELTAGSSVSSALYQAIPHRHTDRSGYHEGRPLAADVVPAMTALVDDPDVRLKWLLTPAQRAAFSTLTVSATDAFIADHQQSRDDYAWYRGTWQQVQDHRDGITVDAGGLSPLVRALGKLTPASRSSNNGYWLSGTRDRQLPTASGFAVVLVRDSADVAQRLSAGRLYQRLHLWATTKGMAMQPLNQSVERAERERATTGPGVISRGLGELLGAAGWQPVMPFRIGYPTTTAPASPRRDVHDVLVRVP